MKNKFINQYLRILPLLIIAPIVYFTWENFGSDALQSAVKAPVNVQATRVGTQAPNFIVDPNFIFSKQKFSLNSVKGSPIILHFWATWCGPCLQELPELIKAADTLRPQGYVFIAVAIDESWKKIDEFFLRNPELATLRDKMILILDPDAKIADLYGSNRFPETFLINKQMLMDNKFTGAQPWMAPEMKVYFNRLIQTGGNP